MSQLYHLAYISRTAIEGRNEDIRVEIERILHVARARNSKTGVTGALLFSGGYFCQVIEGGQRAIEELFETIQMDPRHSDVTVIEFLPIAARSFSDWSMAFAGVDEKERFSIDGIKKSKTEIAMQEVGRNLLSNLERLITQRQDINNEA